LFCNICCVVGSSSYMEEANPPHRKLCTGHLLHKYFRWSCESVRPTQWHRSCIRGAVQLDGKFLRKISRSLQAVVHPGHWNQSMQCNSYSGLSIFIHAGIIGNTTNIGSSNLSKKCSCLVYDKAKNSALLYVQNQTLCTCWDALQAINNRLRRDVASMPFWPV